MAVRVKQRLEPLVAVCERLREQPPMFRLETLEAEAVAHAALGALADFLGTLPQGARPSGWNDSSNRSAPVRRN